MEEEEDEEDIQEGGSGRGDRAVEEEEVGCERVDMTNLNTNEECSKDHSDLFGYRSSMNIRTREKPLFPAPIYSPKMSWKPKRSQPLNLPDPMTYVVWRPKKPLINACHITRSGAASNHFTHHYATDRTPTLRLFDCTSSPAWGANAPIRPDDSMSRPTLRPTNHLTMVRRSHDATWPTDLWQ